MNNLMDDFDWVPARIRLRSAGGSTVQWQHLGGANFTEPFFRETIAAATGPRRETALTELEGVACALPATIPDGFIFHLSRCGSTLLARMLAALPRNLVLSEPAPVNDLLWPEDHPALPEASRLEELLRGVMRVLSRHRAPHGAVVVKFDAWHLLDLPLIRRAFPRVPLVFVYRDPVEIAVSHQRQRGTHMIPGQLEEARAGIPFPSMTAAGLDTFAALVLARLMTAALTHLPADALLVHYREMPAAGLERVLRHFQLVPADAERRVMLAASVFHAKKPGALFKPDSAARQAAASAELRALIADHTGGLYAALERRRAAQD